MILLPNFMGSAKLSLMTPVPNTVKSFDQVLAGGYVPLADFSFGTGPAPAGSTKISDQASLDTYFEAYSKNAGNIVINSELQRYMPTSTPENFVFAPDALELTATLYNPPSNMAVGTATVVGAVSNSRNITVADASAIPVGQVLSLGKSNLANTVMLGISLGPVVGNTLTLKVSGPGTAVPNGFAQIAFTATVQAGDTLDTLAQWFVDQVNGDATMIANKITAYKCPVGVGNLAVNWPARNVNGTPDIGALANGSISAYSITTAKTGPTMLFDLTSAIQVPFVVSKAGNVLTVSQPVTIADGASIKLSPSSLILHRNTAYTNGFTTVPFADTSAITIGQMFSVGFGDTNYRRVVSKTATDITCEATVFVGNGRDVRFFPAWAWPVSVTASNTNVLTFSAVPPSVQPGMQMIHPSVNNSQILVTAVTGTTVTLDQNVSVASGQVMTFTPPIRSAQIWSKMNIRPGELNRDFVAMELTCDLPSVMDFAAWSAFWLYTDTSDAAGSTAQGTGTSEIDMMEQYNYFSNGTAADLHWGTAAPNFDIYNYPGVSGGTLPGNNLDVKTRKIQLVWSPTKAYVYLDGTLIFAKNYSWNAYKRAQIAANLAVGSLGGSFTGSGFFPIDLSRFPMKYRLKRLRVLTAKMPSGMPPDVALTYVNRIQDTPAAPSVNLDIVGNYLYTVNQSKKLLIYDLSNPAIPTLVGSVTDTTNLNGAGGVRVSPDGTRAYVSNEAGASMTVWNVSNKAAPTFVAIQRGPTPGTSLSGASNLRLNAAGTLCLVTTITRNNLALIDVSNPAAPTWLAEVTGLNGARDVILSKDEKTAYVTCDSAGTMGVVDITNPSAPVLVRIMTDPTFGTFARGIVMNAAGTRLFTMGPANSGLGWAGSIGVWDISGAKQNNPTQISAYLGTASGTPGYLAGGRGMVLSPDEKYLYAASEAGDSLSLFDIRDETSIKLIEVNRGGAPGTDLDAAMGLKVKAGYAYISCYGQAASPAGRGIAVVKVDPWYGTPA
jgi:hypothetical protein